MKSLTLFLALTTTVPTHAHSIFKDPKKWAKDVEQDYREDRNRVLQEGADLLSGNSTQREREREKAREAKRRAEEQKRNAEKVRQEKVKGAQERLVSLKASRNHVENTIARLNSAQREVANGIKVIHALIESSKTDKSKLSVVMEIVFDQQRNLIEILSSSPENKEFSDQVENYRKQLEQFPIASATEEEIDALSSAIAEQYFGAIEQLKQEISSQENYLSGVNSNIEETEKTLKTLSL